MESKLYKHWSEVEWCKKKFPNFTAKELSCPCCGEYYHDERALDMLQDARAFVGKPLVINSAHRCIKHNEEVGGTEDSQHLEIAFDISTSGHDRAQLLKALVMARFSTFGYYTTFIHTDTRSERQWSQSPKAFQLWLKS